MKKAAMLQPKEHTPVEIQKAHHSKEAKLSEQEKKSLKKLVMST